MNRLALLALCAVLSCTEAPVRGTQAVPIPASEPSPFNDVQAYAAAVARAIRARLILPVNVPDSASAVYELTLSSDGAVANLQAIRSSGFPRYDEAIQRAIQRAQPFPVLLTADPATPTRLRLTFKAKE